LKSLCFRSSLPAQLWLTVGRIITAMVKVCRSKTPYTSGTAQVGVVTIPAMVACMETDSILQASAMMVVLTSSTDTEISQLTRLCRTPWQPLGAYQAGVYEALAESNEAKIAVILRVPNWRVCERDYVVSCKIVLLDVTIAFAAA
jgi:hypothetical protein